MIDQTNMVKLLTVRQVAEILQCNVQQIYRYAGQGFFSECLVKIGNLNTLRFNPEKLMGCISRGSFGGKADTTGMLKLRKFEAHHAEMQ